MSHYSWDVSYIFFVFVHFLEKLKFAIVTGKCSIELFVGSDQIIIVIWPLIVSIAQKTLLNILLNKAHPKRRTEQTSISLRMSSLALLWNMPAWMIFASIFNLKLALSKICCSNEFCTTNLKTLTSCVWPILWARSWACKSMCGFLQIVNVIGGTLQFSYQSVSKIITVSAVCRLSPKPPAWVLKTKMK